MAPSLTSCVLLLIFGAFSASAYASKGSLPKDMHRGNVLDRTGAFCRNILHEFGHFFRLFFFLLFSVQSSRFSERDNEIWSGYLIMARSALTVKIWLVPMGNFEPGGLPIPVGFITNKLVEKRHTYAHTHTLTHTHTRAYLILFVYFWCCVVWTALWYMLVRYCYIMLGIRLLYNWSSSSSSLL